MESVKQTKAFKAFLKALDCGIYFLLMTFAVIFAFLAVVAVAQGFNVFNLFGFAGCAFISWTCWSIRKD